MELDADRGVHNARALGIVMAAEGDATAAAPDGAPAAENNELWTTILRDAARKASGIAEKTLLVLGAYMHELYSVTVAAYCHVAPLLMAHGV